MKWRSLIAGATLALAANVSAEDKITVDLDGEIAVQGISLGGALVGDSVPDIARHAIDGKLSIVTKEGELHRIETYTEWSAENGVHAVVWERLYVSGGAYTGWTERLIQTPKQVVFSRNVIDGKIMQEIKPDGSGYIEWTVAGDDNGVDNDPTTDTATSDSDADSSGSLPDVEILEQGAFDGVSDRRIEIDTHHDRPEITFTDSGYERVTVNELFGTHPATINQNSTLEGRGKGSLAYVPVKPSSDATPTPTPSVLPTPTPTPVTIDTSDSSDDGTF